MVGAFSFGSQNIGTGAFLPKLSKKSTKFIGGSKFFHRKLAGQGCLFKTP
jgi:hypothetical protein